MIVSENPGRLTPRDMQVLLDLLRYGPLATDLICNRRFSGSDTYCRERLHQLRRRGWLEQRSVTQQGRRRSVWALTVLGRRTAESLAAEAEE